MDAHLYLNGYHSITRGYRKTGYAYVDHRFEGHLRTVGLTAFLAFRLLLLRALANFDTALVVGA